LNQDALYERFNPEALLQASPAIVLVAAIIGLWLFLRHRVRLDSNVRSDRVFRYQMATIGLFLSLVLVVVIFLPMSVDRRGQLLSLLGVLLSAMLALSSTSILGNMLAGFMLRAQNSFRPGDFLSVGEHFGRISERGLFHTEIQTEDRDLTSLPNLYLSRQPFTVLRATGTLVSATVSLGYEVPRKSVKRALSDGAVDAGLKDPFVRILELGDFSVVYRVSGLLTEVKQLVSARARLHSRVLDALHSAGIEIVSPNFMNQRVLDPSAVFIPTVEAAKRREETFEKIPQRVMFDKAEVAGSVEELRDLLSRTLSQIETLRAGDTTDPAVARELERQQKRASWLEEYIPTREREAD